MARANNTIGVFGDIDAGPGGYVHSDIDWVGDANAANGVGTPDSVGYQEGNLVSLEGVLWVANRDNDNHRPGTELPVLDDDGNPVIIGGVTQTFQSWDRHTAAFTLQDANARSFFNNGYSVSRSTGTLSISFFELGAPFNTAVAERTTALSAFNAPEDFDPTASSANLAPSFATPDELSMRVFSTTTGEIDFVEDGNGQPVPFVVPAGTIITVRANFLLEIPGVLTPEGDLANTPLEQQRISVNLSPFGVRSTAEILSPLQLDRNVRFRPTAGLEGVVTGVTPDRIVSFGIRDGGVGEDQLADQAVTPTKVSTDIATTFDIANADINTRDVQQARMTGTDNVESAVTQEEVFVLSLPNTYDSGSLIEEAPIADIADAGMIIPRGETRVPTLTASGPGVVTNAYNFVLSNNEVPSVNAEDYSNPRSIPGESWQQVRSIAYSVRTEAELVNSFTNLLSGPVGERRIVVYADATNWAVYRITGFFPLSANAVAISVDESTHFDGVIGAATAMDLFAGGPELVERREAATFNVDIDTTRERFNAANFNNGDGAVTGTVPDNQNAIQTLQYIADQVVARWGAANQVDAPAQATALVTARAPVEDTTTGLTTVQLRTGVSDVVLSPAGSITGINTQLPQVPFTTETTVPLTFDDSPNPPGGRVAQDLVVPEDATNLVITLTSIDADGLSQFVTVTTPDPNQNFTLREGQEVTRTIPITEALRGTWTLSVGTGSVVNIVLTRQVVSQRQLGFVSEAAQIGGSIYTVTQPGIGGYTFSFTSTPTDTRQSIANRIVTEINSRTRPLQERRTQAISTVEWIAEAEEETLPGGVADTLLTLTSATSVPSPGDWVFAVDHGTVPAEDADRVIQITPVEEVGVGGVVIDSIDPRSPVNHGVITTVPEFPEAHLDARTYALGVDTISQNGQVSWVQSSIVRANDPLVDDDLTDAIPTLRSLTVDGVLYQIASTEFATNAFIEHADPDNPVPFVKYADDQDVRVNLIIDHVAPGVRPTGTDAGEWAVPPTLMIAVNDGSAANVPVPLNTFSALDRAGIRFVAGEVNRVTIPLIISRTTEMINLIPDGSGVTIEISGSVADQTVVSQLDEVNVTFTIEAANQLRPPVATYAGMPITTEAFSRSRLADAGAEVLEITFNSLQADINAGRGFAIQNAVFNNSTDPRIVNLPTSATDVNSIAVEPFVTNTDYTIVYPLTQGPARTNPFGQTESPPQVNFTVNRFAPVLFTSVPLTTAPVQLGAYLSSTTAFVDGGTLTFPTVTAGTFYVLVADLRVASQAGFGVSPNAMLRSPDGTMLALNDASRVGTLTFNNVAAGTDVDTFAIHELGMLPASTVPVTYTMIGG